VSKAPEFSFTPEQVRGIFDGSVQELEAALKAVAALPAGQRTFANTVLGFENALGKFGEAVHIPTLLAYVSDDAELRKASQELELRVNQYSVDLMTREDLFNALNEYAAKGEKLGEVDARLLEKILREFKDNGLGLPPRRKNKVKKLMKDLVAIEQEYQKNQAAASHKESPSAQQGQQTAQGFGLASGCGGTHAAPPVTTKPSSRPRGLASRLTSRPTASAMAIMDSRPQPPSRLARPVSGHQIRPDIGRPVAPSGRL